MKKLALLFLIALSSLSVSAQFTQFGDTVKMQIYTTLSDLYITENDEFYIATVTDGTDELHCQKKVGNAWLSIDSISNVFQSIHDNVSLEYNEVGDTLYVVATADDGIHTYFYEGGTVHPAALYPCSPHSANKPLTAMVQDSNDVYIMLHADGELQFIRYNGGTGTYDSLAAPTPQLYDTHDSFELVYNEADGFFYFIYHTSTGISIVLYNGTSWLPYVPNIGDDSNEIIVGAGMGLDNTGEHLLVSFSSHINGTQFKHKVVQIKLSNNSITVLESISSTATNFQHPTAVYNPISEEMSYIMDVDVANSYNLFSCDEMGNCQDFGTVPTSYFIDLEHDSAGNLYMTYNADSVLVYKMDLFDVSVAELENEPMWVHPNPATTQLYATTDQELYVSLYTIRGELILEDRVMSGSIPLDLSAVPNGLYLLNLTDQDNKQYQQKLVVDH